MVVFLPQLTMINIEIPAHFPSGSARTRTRGGAWRMRDAIGKITGGGHNLGGGGGVGGAVTGQHRHSYPSRRSHSRVGRDNGVLRTLDCAASARPRYAEPGTRPLSSTDDRDGARAGS